MNRLAEPCIFDLLARIVNRKVEVANVDQFSSDAFAFLDFAENEFSDVLAGAAFPNRAENYRNEEWSSVHSRRVSHKKSQNAQFLRLLLVPCVPFPGLDNDTWKVIEQCLSEIGIGKTLTARTNFIMLVNYDVMFGIINIYLPQPLA